MVIRETPKNLKGLIRVSGNIGDILQKKGFSPLYMDNQFLYFRKEKKIELLIGKGVNE